MVGIRLWVRLAASVGLVVWFSLGPTVVAHADGPTMIPNDRFGINFVSAPGVSFADQTPRYLQATQAGAGWNRWPLYWSNLERNCDRNFDWSLADTTVNADVSNNLQIDAILLGDSAMLRHDDLACHGPATRYDTASWHEGPLHRYAFSAGRHLQQGLCRRYGCLVARKGDQPGESLG
jgi:hypothetical protein